MPRTIYGKTEMGIEQSYQKICKNMDLEGLTELEFRIKESIRLKKVKLKVVKYWKKKKFIEGTELS